MDQDQDKETGEPRDAWLHVRLTTAERKALIDRARRDGVGVSELARAGLAAVLAGTAPTVELGQNVR